MQNAHYEQKAAKEAEAQGRAQEAEMLRQQAFKPYIGYLSQDFSRQRENLFDFTCTWCLSYGYDKHNLFLRR